MPIGAIETRLTALEMLAKAALSGDFRRDEPLPAEIPSVGLIIMESGETGEPEITFPLTYHYRHAVPFTIYVQQHEDAEDVIDALRQELGAAIAADRTLGGLCDWVEAQITETDTVPFTGTTTLRFERITVTMSYGIANPLT